MRDRAMSHPVPALGPAQCLVPACPPEQQHTLSSYPQLSLLNPSSLLDAVIGLLTVYWLCRYSVCPLHCAPGQACPLIWMSSLQCWWSHPQPSPAPHPAPAPTTHTLSVPVISSQGSKSKLAWAPSFGRRPPAMPLHSKLSIPFSNDKMPLGCQVLLILLLLGLEKAYYLQ